MHYACNHGLSRTGLFNGRNFVNSILAGRRDVGSCHSEHDTSLPVHNELSL